MSAPEPKHPHPTAPPHPPSTPKPKHYTEAELNGMPVASINIVGRVALGPLNDALHNIYRITRVDGQGHHVFQDISALPHGGNPATSEHGVLRFHIGVGVDGNNPPITRSDDLTVPPGMTLNGYANALIAGAHYYNKHSQINDYDPIGGERHNSNGANASLGNAIGGETFLKDLHRFTGPDAHSREVTEPIQLDHSKPRQTDYEESGLQTGEWGKGFVATGLDNLTPKSEFRRIPNHPTSPLDRATPEPARTPEPPMAKVEDVVGGETLRTGLVRFAEYAATAMKDRVKDALAVNVTNAQKHVDATHKMVPALDHLPPRDRGVGLEVRYEGRDYHANPGARFSGMISDVSNTSVTLSTAKGIYVFQKSELARYASGATDFHRAVHKGSPLSISVEETDVDLKLPQMRIDHARVNGQGQAIERTPKRKQSRFDFGR